MQNFTDTNQISPLVIENRLTNGYNLDIGSYLSNGWAIFKTEWVTFSLYSLIVLLITSTGIGALVIFPLTLGFYLGADKVAKGESLSLNDMFAGFNNNLGRLVFLAIIPLLIMIVLFIPLFTIIVGVESTGGNSDMIGMASVGFMLLFYLLIFIAAIALNLAMFYAPYLIYFGDYTVMEAIKTSWKLSTKNALMIFVFIILIGFLTQIGLFLCMVGVIVSMAFAYVCYYPLIKDVLFDEKVNIAP